MGVGLSKCLLGAACMAALAIARPALAAPGAGEEVYGATVDPHELELETRYGVLAGGPDAGEDNLRFEAGYGVSGHVRVAVVGEFEREAGGRRRATHLGFEAIANVARVGGVDVAVYGEFEKGLNGDPDGVEAKLLVERRTRLWDLRFDLIAEKPFDAAQPTEFGYAASVDVAVANRLRLGVTGFGELGTTDRLFPNAEHYVGPTVKLALPGLVPGLNIEASYLFALGAARDNARGQFRTVAEIEF